MPFLGKLIVKCQICQSNAKMLFGICFEMLHVSIIPKTVNSVLVASKTPVWPPCYTYDQLFMVFAISEIVIMWKFKQRTDTAPSVTTQWESSVRILCVSDF